jgi:hypothetical protein
LSGAKYENPIAFRWIACGLINVVFDYLLPDDGFSRAKCDAYTVTGNVSFGIANICPDCVTFGVANCGTKKVAL